MNKLRLLIILLMPFLALAGQAQAQTAATNRVILEARLTPDGISVERGIEWRVFGTRPDENGQLPVLANASGGTRAFDMTPGQYLVHAAYGHASAVRRIEVGGESDREVFVLNAGGLELSAVAGNDTPISGDLLRFDVYEDQQDERGERRLIARKILPGEIVPFPEGTYHVVSVYGNLNAEIRADLRVKAGEVTHAQLKHRAARITLRLVRNAGGDALADTKWTVLTEAGELITESTSAFPRIVLLEGNYTAIAKNADRIYSQDFTVEAGINRDVEVLVEG